MNRRQGQAVAVLVMVAAGLGAGIVDRITREAHAEQLHERAQIAQLLHDDMDAVQADITTGLWADCRTNTAIYNADADNHPDYIPAGMPWRLDPNEYCGAIT